MYTIERKIVKFMKKSEKLWAALAIQSTISTYYL